MNVKIVHIVRLLEDLAISFVGAGFFQRSL